MPKLDLINALRIKASGGEIAALKGDGFSWQRPQEVGPLWDAEFSAPVYGIEDGDTLLNISGGALFNLYGVGTFALVGKKYWELLYLVGPGATTFTFIGIVHNRDGASSGQLRFAGFSWANNGNIGGATSNTNLGYTYASGDRLMFAYDADTRHIHLGKNGVWFDDPATDPPSYIRANTSNPVWVAAQLGPQQASLRTFSDNVIYPLPAGYSTVQAP